MDKKRIDVISLGCSKNLVDSERLLKQLELSGFQAFHNSDNVDGDIVIINTCGFIGDAKEESINTILTYAEAKNEGRIKELYVMGCLSERYRDDLLAEIPEIDRIYGKFDWVNIVSDIIKRNPATMPYDRVITTPSHYTYLKIAEGCNRFCAFCAIPLITGRYKSRPIEEILEEVRRLVGKGVKEFNVIAQDLSSYGLDIYKRLALPELIDRMAEIDGVKWIRLHYAYPFEFPYEILDVMARHSNVCNYLDIALQHINNDVLKNMRRHITKEETLALIRTIREKVPGIHIRTTLMVGFPGETDDDFRQLMDFVRWAKFERMGAFAYSEEEGTPSARLYTDDVPSEVKERRLSDLMALQQEISVEVQGRKVGQTLKVVIDRQEGDYYVGRSEYSSPEVDPEVLIPVSEGSLSSGHYYPVLITDADEFDLYGSIASSPCKSRKHEQ